MQKAVPERAPLPAEHQREVDALTHEAETLAELDELDDEQQERLESIQDRIEELDSREPVWPPETLAIAGAVVTLGGNGKADVQRGFIRPEDAPAEAWGCSTGERRHRQNRKKHSFGVVAGKLDGTSLRSANRRIDPTA